MNYKVLIRYCWQYRETYCAGSSEWEKIDEGHSRGGLTKQKEINSDKS